MVYTKQKLNRKKRKAKKEKTPESMPKDIPLLNNVIIAILFVILIFKLKDQNPGYRWVHESLIEANLKTIKKYKNLTFEQRQEAKMGFNATYLNFVKNNTPDTAIILMPPDSIILPVKGKSEFSKHMKNKAWCSYLIYPRRLVYEREKSNSSLYESVTHVAIMNGWGYDKLAYPIKDKSKHTILPIKN